MSVSSIIVVGVSLLLALVSSWIVLRPFLSSDSDEEKDGSRGREQTSNERETLLLALEDLESEFRAGKVTEESYREAKLELAQKISDCSRPI